MKDRKTIQLKPLIRSTALEIC